MAETKLSASKSRNGQRDGWMGAGMGLALIVAALLSIGGTSANVTNESLHAAAPVEIAPALIANADRDILDLQLD
ncbi:MAG: hypothetical protein LC796_09955 [Acidobacteria bacterium]|nr:hypothetical protein [Acidobacteriota bacterium]MCA1609777.1 hypothetical protein [Acidobacteriota bacterium]